MVRTTQLANTEVVAIKDRLKNWVYSIRASKLLQAVRAIPRPALWGGSGLSGAVVGLLAISYTLANVVAHQGYDYVAFATPAAEARILHQTEAAQFGYRVSEAFGVRNDVALEFADWILEAAERQRLAPELLASLVVTESSFRKSVRSHVGAIGPTQIRPDYWGEFCGRAEDLHDPEQNVYCGAQVLSYLLERCSGDTSCALAAYNVGPYARRAAAADRYLKKIDGYLSSFEERTL